MIVAVLLHGQAIFAQVAGNAVVLVLAIALLAYITSLVRTVLAPATVLRMYLASGLVVIPFLLYRQQLCHQALYECSILEQLAFGADPAIARLLPSGWSFWAGGTIWAGLSLVFLIARAQFPDPANQPHDGSETASGRQISGIRADHPKRRAQARVRGAAEQGDEADER